jgi:hypothetical protein
MANGSPIPGTPGKYSIYYRWDNHNVLSRIFSDDWNAILKDFERLAGDPLASDIQLFEGHLIATASETTS